MDEVLHKHNHEHDHGHGCCDEHETQHEVCSCGCCHDHDDDENSKLKIVLLCISAALLICALIFHLLKFPVYIVMILSIMSALISGYRIYIEGIKAIFRLKIDETTLMTVASVAAMILGEFIEGAAVTLLFSIGELLEDYAVGKSRKEIHSLINIRPDSANLIVGDEIKVTDAKDIEKGSLLLINPHEIIPIDGDVTDGMSYVNPSAVTGEEVPINAKKGTHLLSGMLNGDSQIKMVTTETFSNSTASRIIDLVERSEKNKGEREKLITRFARVYTPVIIIISILIAVIPSIITGDWRTWITRALTCLVASCPCSIVISIPLAYFAGIGNLAKSGVLIKGGKFIETLSKCLCFAFDKTGTLTKSEMKVESIETRNGKDEEYVLKTAVSLERFSSHPVAQAVTKYSEDRITDYFEIKEYKEIPGKGTQAEIENKAVSCSSDDENTGIVVKENGEIIGIINISDTIRDESKGVLSELRTLGIKKLMMLSGDKDKTTKKAADKLRIDYKASLKPSDKVTVIEELQNEYGNCAFVGDGINDAPVLSKASCGIAMGLGTQAAIESSDMVLSSGNLTNLPAAVKKSRKIMTTVKINLIFSLLFKLAVIILATLGLAPMWLAVLSDTGVCMLCVINSTRLTKMH